MKYISTRSKEKEYNFGEVFIKGLADDGGLYVPESLKRYSKEELLALKNLNYNELSTKNNTKIKNKYKIEYPKTFLAFFKTNSFFLNLYRS